MAEQKSHNGSSQDPLKGSEERVIEDVFLRYLQGELALSEMEAFEKAAARDPEQAETVRAYAELLVTLKMLLPDSELSDQPEMRARIMSIPDRKPVSQVVRATEGEWISSGMMGFEFKLLFVDPDTKKSTVLARIAAGARMPHHRHRGTEECLIIEGSLWTDGVLLQAGDFIVTQDQTEHDDTWSPNGALALLKTYLSDEILSM
jgi:anti-sigma factor ChrR (cupin superfamily)